MGPSQLNTAWPDDPGRSPRPERPRDTANSSGIRSWHQRKSEQERYSTLYDIFDLNKQTPPQDHQHLRRTDSAGHFPWGTKAEDWGSIVIDPNVSSKRRTLKEQVSAEKTRIKIAPDTRHLPKNSQVAENISQLASNSKEIGHQVILKNIHS